MQVKTVHIHFDTIEDIKIFVSEVSKFDASFNVQSGRYIANGKSILGMFSLDFSKDLTVRIEVASNDPDDMYEILYALKPYIRK